MRRTAPCLPVSLALLLLCGCATTTGPAGSDDLSSPSDMGPGSGGLTLTPNPILLTTSGDPVKAPFKVISSTDGDVTARASFTLADPVGTAAAGTLTTYANLSRGYRTTLTARYGVQSGTAAVLVKFAAADFLDPQTPQDPGSYFGKDDSGAKPAWVYPLTGALLPPNLDPVTLQFSGATAALLYRIQFECASYTRTLYLTLRTCTAGQCQFTPPVQDWRNLARSCAGDTLSLSLAASPGPGKPFGTDGPRTVLFSPDNIKGGLYYWSSTLSGLYRAVAGSAQRHEYLRMGNTYGCGSCHAVSQDGGRVAVSLKVQGNGLGGVLDGQNGQSYLLQPPSGGNWELSSFSPKGDMLLVNNGGTAMVIDPVRGDILYKVPMDLVGGAIVQPVWSPDGQMIAFIRLAPPTLHSYDPLNAGDLMVMRFNNGNFSLADLVVAATPQVEYQLHPSWTPDSKWILFNTVRVPCNTGGGTFCYTYNASNTLLQIVRAQPGGTPVTLLNARQKANSSTNWPRAVPAFQAGGKLLFFSFHTRATYGNVKNDDHYNLWMSAIDMDLLQSQPGRDPSFPPFWVPGQQPGETNVLAAWTTQIGCQSKTDCPAGFDCAMGQCVAQVE